MEKILITGIHGRIGQRISRYLKDSYEIIGVDNEKEKEEDFFDYYYIDFSSPQSIHQGFQTIFQKHSEIHSVIHLIAYYSFEGGGYGPYQKITVEGTKNLLKELALGTVHQFIFSSTLLIHAPCKTFETINENSPLKSSWEYPRSKIEAEEAILSRKAPFPAVILRIAGCYDEECHSIPIANQIDRIYKKKIKSHFFPGNLQSGAPYLHFDDLCQAIELTIKKRDTLSNNEPFLLGEETTPTHLELQHAIGTLLWNKPWTTFRIPKWLAKIGAFIHLHTPLIKKPFIRPWMIDFADDFYALDLSKSHSLLGWEPKHSLMKTLPTMIEKLKANPHHWYTLNKLSL